MNYKSIIAKAIEENSTQKTPYSIYFKREAKKAKDIEHEELDDFFDGCLRIIALYKKQIEWEYLKDYKENDWVLETYKQNILNGITKDDNGVLLQTHIDHIEKKKEYIKNLGFETNANYTCLITESGEIAKDYFDSAHELNYSKIVEIENCILRLKSDLTSKMNNSTNGINNLKKNNLDIVLINKIYNFCIETKVLDKNTITNVDFINAVEIADFLNIYKHSKEMQSSTKMRYIIYVLSKYNTSNNWFMNAAHSINTEPTKCSGVNVPTKWKNDANAIK